MSKPIGGVEPTEWAKHLRSYGKRQFWKRHRRALYVEDLSDADIEAIGTSKVIPKKTKLRKRFGFEYRYITKPAFDWMTVKPWNQWRRYYQWYATAKDRDAAYKALMKTRKILGYEYRPVER